MSSKINITFLLPGPGLIPVGGFKVVYEYANHLARRQHHVTIIHCGRAQRFPSMKELGIGLVRYVQRRIDKSFLPTKWFAVDSSVEMRWVPSLAVRHIPDADAVIATSWKTAEWVHEYPAAKGECFYLLQHLETWSGPEDRVYATWKMPYHKVVISHWLEQIAASLEQHSTYIPNGLDFNSFGLDALIETRDPLQAMMMYSTQEWKGTCDGLEAFHLVREMVPGFRVALFGIHTPPRELPEWITYYRRPAAHVLRNLYNQAAVFLAPSWVEGWGLPATEAMMCGAAVVATDISGHKDFAYHEDTALVNPPKDAPALARNIIRYIQNPELRFAVARRGHQYVQRFTWERSTTALEALLLDVCRSESSGTHSRTSGGGDTGSDS